MKVRIPLTYSMIYGNVATPPGINSIQRRLAPYHRETLLNLTIDLLGLSRQDLSVTDFCKFYFTPNEISFAKDFLIKYNKVTQARDNQHALAPDYIVLGIIGALELLSIVISLPTSGSTIDKSNIKKDVFLSLLEVNEINMENIHLPESGENMNEAYRALFISLSYDDIINDNKNWTWMLQIYKAYEFFKFCTNDSRYQHLLKVYFNTNGFENWEDFLGTMIVLTGLWKSETDIFQLNPELPSYTRNKNLFAPLAIKKDDVIPYAVDFKTFRDKPLIEISKDKYIVVERFFLFHKIYSSIFFGLMRINSKFQTIKDLAQDLSYRFTEQILFQKTISAMFASHKYIKYSGKEMDESELCGTPDFYIRSGNNVFVFEFKDVKFTKEAKTCKDYSFMENFLREKLVEKSSNRPNRPNHPSAAYQLANFINVLYLKQFPLDKNYNPQKIKIYPIIVTGDSTFTCYGISPIINQYFRHKLDDIGINNVNIRDVAILSLDNAIAFQDNFRLRKNNFKDVLDNYYRFIKEDAPFKVRAQGDIMLNMIHPMFSLSNYMQLKVPVEKQISYLAPLFNSIRTLKGEL